MNDGPFIPNTPSRRSKPASKGGIVATGAIATLLAASMIPGTTTSAPLEQSDGAVVGAVTIDGPAAVDAGDLVFLSAVGDAKGYAWTCFPVNSKWRAIEGGKTVVAAFGKPATYTFILATASGDIPTISVKEVKVGQPSPGPDPPPGPGPSPNPNPPPGPGPTPVVPDGEFGLTRFAYTEAMKVAAEHRVKASAFGDNFAAVSAQLVAGGYLSIALANADLKERNSTTLGTARDPWMPFFQAEAAKLQTLQTSGQVADMPTLGRAYKAVADGLRLVK